MPEADVQQLGEHCADDHFDLVLFVAAAVASTAAPILRCPLVAAELAELAAAAEATTLHNDLISTWSLFLVTAVAPDEAFAAVPRLHRQFAGLPWQGPC